MKTIRRLIIWTLFFVLCGGGIGCLGIGQTSSIGIDEQPGDKVSNPTPTNPTPTNPTPTNPTPTNPTQLKPVCTPKPMLLEPVKLGMEQPYKVLSANCRMTSRKQTSNGVLTDSKSFSYSGNKITVLYARPGKATYKTVYTVDGTGRVTGQHVSDLNGNVYNHYQQTFDEQGRLLDEQISFKSGSGSRKTQLFNGSRLTSQIIVSGSHTATTSFSYNAAGLLIRVLRTSTKPTELAQSVDWTYDAQNRPIKQERRIGGELVLRQEWSWNEKNLLLRRVIALDGFRYHELRQLDSMDSSLAMGSYPYNKPSDDVQTWGFLPDRKPQTDCQRLHAAPGHGYPESEYRLGFKEKAPFGGALLGLYRAGRHGYVTELPFYTHYGIGNDYMYYRTIPRSEPGQWMRLALSYVDGRMTEERALLVPAEQAQQLDFDKPGPDSALYYLRTRLYEEGGLLSDEQTFMEDGLATSRRTLLFTYDNQGRLKQRQLLDDEQVIEFQRITYDVQGRTSRLEVYGQPGDTTWNVQDQFGVPADPGFRTPLWLGTLEHKFDGEVLKSESIQTDAMVYAMGNTVVHEFDAAGRWLATKRYAGNLESITENSYSPGGLLLSKTIDSDNDGKPENIEEHSYNPFGLTTQIKQQYHRTTGNLDVYLTRFDYSCN